MGICLLVYDYRIVKYRQNSKDPCCPPLFCKKRDVLPDSVPGRFDLHRLSILFYGAFHDLPQSEYGLHQFRSLGAYQSADSKDLSFFEFEADVLEGLGQRRA